MNSLWTDTVNLPEFPASLENHHADVLIIGGGMAGLLCAYFLQQSGVRCLLLEAGRIGGGVTGCTTAKLTVQHRLIYHKIARKYGLDSARLYLEANQQALAQYRRMCRTIDCEFETKESFLYTLGQTDSLEEELDVLQKLGADVSFCQQLPLPLKTTGAICVPHQAQFHPLKFLSHICRGLQIQEHTRVQAFDGRGWITNRGRFTAKQTIITTHFPICNKHGGYYLKLYQHRSYVLALKNAAAVDGMYLDVCNAGLSFRNYGDLLLLGGGAHRTGKPGGGWDSLRDFARLHYPQAREEYHWATQDCMSLDGIPYIGRYGKHTPQLYVATGFNKWGMTSSMAAALLLRDLVLGKVNPYAALFSPQRKLDWPQLMRNGLAAAGNLLTPTRPRCPHLGCALKWNPQERSWDCPCHGSRFDAVGTLLDNPATGALHPPSEP